MNYYKDENLGMDVDPGERVSIPQAVHAGTLEGIGDAAKYLTLGLIVLTMLIVIPKGPVKRLRAAIRGR